MSTGKRLVAAAFVVISMVFAAVSLGAGSASAAYPPGTNPSIALSKSSGLTGDSVVVTGSGFSLNSSAALSFHSTAVSLGSVSTSSTGTFTTTITVPNVAVGPHTISATDGGTGQVASAAFAVTGQGALGSGGSGSGSGGGGGGLASTGVAVLGIASLGLVLLIGGGLMLLAGRRRKVSA